MKEIKEPEEFSMYPFLIGERRAKVDNFLSRLDDQCRTFALKRYSECKTISQIAEEMGYSERNLFKFRRKILMRWYFQNQKVS